MFFKIVSLETRQKGSVMSEFSSFSSLYKSRKIMGYYGMWILFFITTFSAASKNSPVQSSTFFSVTCFMSICLIMLWTHWRDQKKKLIKLERIFIIYLVSLLALFQL